MRIDSRKLTGLTVATESGEALGKVLSFDVDVESHAVTGYRVGPGGWSRQVSSVISPAQVVVLTAERMVVSDNTVRVSEGERVASVSPIPGVSPVVTSQD